MIDPEKDKHLSPPAKVHGIAHIFAASRYSFGGFLQLLKETAFRFELLGFALFALLFWLLGASYAQFAVLSCLFLLLFAVEALNTAIEHIVDHLSPHRSDFAKNTKDLGSFAVFCLLAIVGFYGLGNLYILMFLPQ